MYQVAQRVQRTQGRQAAFDQAMAPSAPPAAPTPQPSPHKAVAPATASDLCHPSLVKTAYTFYSYTHQRPMKAAKEVGHRRQPVRCGHPATLPHMAVAPATRRDSGGVEARAPIRCRRAHSHRPGLCSDKWGASCPDVWSRGRRASPRQRGSCLGRRRSDGGPGPTKPVQPSSTPQRGASSRTCHRPQRPRNPPLQGRRASDPAGLAALAGLVPRPPSERRRSWSYEAGPAADTASAQGALPYMRPPATTPQPAPHKAVAPATRSGDLPGQGGRHASKKHS